MLPDPHLPSLGPIHPFGVLVATGIALGMWLTVKRARDAGLDENVANDVGMWAVIPGFIGAHLYEVFFYTPERILVDPLVIFKVWDGISSFGGFLGGTLGVIFYLTRVAKVPFWHYADTIMYGFTCAWIFGRLGCTVAFDHPGPLTDFVLGMQYNGAAVSHGVRHNLGFYEAIWAAGLFAFFFVTRHKPRVPGFYLLTFVLAYMPFRFGLDFLRVDDKVYWGLTPAQYAALVLCALTLVLFVKRLGINEKVVPDGQVHVFPDGTPAVLPSGKRPATARPKVKKKSA